MTLDYLLSGRSASGHRHPLMQRLKALRDVPDIRGLDHRQTLGDHTPQLSQPGASQGEGAGGEPRDQESQAEGINEESQRIGRGSEPVPREGRFVSQPPRQPPERTTLPSDQNVKQEAEERKAALRPPQKEEKPSGAVPRGKQPKREASPILERPENTGILLWHGLVVVALNWVHSGGNIGEGLGPQVEPATSRRKPSAASGSW